MPSLPRTQTRTIDVDAGFLPFPATKLVVTQYLETSQDPPYWALIIVAAFYDGRGRPVWSTELFAANLAIELESDDEDENDDASSVAELVEEADDSDSSTVFSDDVSDGASHERQASVDARSSRPSPGSSLLVPAGNIYYAVPPALWNPAVDGPVPGHWQASFLLSTLLYHLPRFTRRPLNSSSFVVDMSGGWNPIAGRDPVTSRPPMAPYGGAPIPPQGQPYHAGPGYPYGSAPQYGTWTNVAYGLYTAGTPGNPVFPGPGPATGYYAHQTFAQQPPNGAGSPFARVPQPWPVIDPAMPAAHLTNSTGGVGCEPGYNYFFPSDHAKVHVFRSNVPPWRASPTTQIPFSAAHIPCNTTVAELMRGFGCTNPSPKKNKVVEITSGGGGRWYKGIEISGNDKENMKKTIGELGWDSTRTGLPNQKPVVCLWFCKD
ncbi:hypothetical protein HIM_02228 [Hirsutella minnesotensis 3608]|nr:hypothetical protein HIM_02228 [Hirsutella minnesotensis 3608]